MSYIEFTEARDTASSAVEALYFNENDNTLIIDWNDELYRYSGVNRQEYEKVLNGTGFGGSVGRAASALKQKYGPGEHLGDYDDVDDRMRWVGFKRPVLQSVTKEFSLQTPVAPVVESDEDVKGIQVVYRLEGYDSEYTFDSSTASVEAALLELSSLIATLGLKGKAVRAVVNFE